MANTPTAASLRAVLGSQTVHKTVHAAAIWKVISAAGAPEERAELLSIALTERDSVAKIPKALPNKGLEDGVWEELVKTHVDMVNGHLKMAFFKSRTAKEFAQEILRLIDFFQEEQEAVFVLTLSLYSPYVPYHQLPGTPVHMTAEDYRHKLESEGPRVELIDYIVGLPFTERTERASMLLQVLDDTSDQDLRVALLAHADFRVEKAWLKIIDDR